MARHAEPASRKARREPELPGIAGGPDLKEAKAPEPPKLQGPVPPSFGDALPIADDIVRRRAFELWQAAGRPQGANLARWFEGIAPSKPRRH